MLWFAKQISVTPVPRFGRAFVPLEREREGERERVRQRERERE